ncbi:MAG: YtxH domain-containing protein [Nitrospira sp. BO4]|nr:YtxH domain-containing protein [Nitrospira sp. BO4]
MHHRRDHNEEAGGWSAFLAGALIGAGVALLFAPQQGSELRGRLRDYATRTKDDLVDKAEETWDTAMERGKEYYDKGEEVVREAGQSAKEFAAQGVRQGEKVVKEAGRSVKAVAQHVRDGDR